MKSKDRHSIRLRGYDYSQPGAYFITICTAQGICHFGEFAEYQIIPTMIGKKAEEYWQRIPNHYSHVILDQYVIMPNHVHGILILKHSTGQDVGVQNFEPLQHRYQHVIPNSLGSIIRTYKSSVTRWCRLNGFDHFRWQRHWVPRCRSWSLRTSTEMRMFRIFGVVTMARQKTLRECGSVQPKK